MTETKCGYCYNPSHGMELCALFVRDMALNLRLDEHIRRVNRAVLVFDSANVLSYDPFANPNPKESNP